MWTAKCFNCGFLFIEIPISTLKEKAADSGQEKPVLLKEMVPDKTKRIGADGNCLFRALSYCVVGSEKFHKEIRQGIVNFIMDHAAQFAKMEGVDVEVWKMVTVALLTLL